MRKTTYWVVLCATALGMSLTSCETLQLEEITNDAVLSDQFVAPSQAALANSGLYALMHQGRMFGGYGLQFADMRGNDIVSRTFFGGFAFGNSSWTEIWSRLYAITNQANILIDYYESGEGGSGPLIDAYLGEAYFVRALSMFYLLQYYAQPYSWDGNRPPTVSLPTGTGTHVGVIIRTAPVLDPAGNSAPRSTVAECYQQLFADLDVAENLLPNRDFWESELDVDGNTRATVEAAIALKARAALHTRDWARAVTESAKIVSGSGPFSSPTDGSITLNASPLDRFSTFTTGESIFSLEQDVADVTIPNVNEAMAIFYNSAAQGARAIFSVNPDMVTQTGWNTTTDIRYTEGIEEGALVSGGLTRYVLKYTDIATATDWIPMIAYSEVLLNYAEALTANTGSVNATAIDLLNAVHVRAGNTAYVAGDFANSDALLAAIRSERRIELLGEGHDLFNKLRIGVGSTSARTGTNLAVASRQLPYGSERLIWTVPQAELDVNPQFGPQNPGW